MSEVFEKVFLPNRGVIAARAIRTLRDLGIQSVVGYSECDRFSLAVRMADEARRLGPSPAKTSYLNVGRVIRAAQVAGCDALFPGYGFLAESPELAEACEAAGITFIGPPPSVLRHLARKDRGRQALSDAGFAVLPGTCAVTGMQDIAAFGQEIGYPLMIKPIAGAGGLGSARIDGPREIRARLAHARSVAAIAFGDDAVCVEKLLDGAAAISVQFVTDQYGNAIHLGEREGSIQHGYRKLLDEAPSTKLDPGRRAELGQRVARAMAALGYVTAGTVEFLLDPDGEAYAIEVNPRIQVEHVATEMVTRTDIVELMIRTAAGEPLPLTQEDVVIRGHAIQCRIKAEDPRSGFVPGYGRITHLEMTDDPQVRYDTGIYQGCNVPMYYDSLLLQACAVDADRTSATERLAASLAAFRLRGVATTALLHQRILEHPGFRDGGYDTSFLDLHLQELLGRSDERHLAARPGPTHRGSGGVAVHRFSH